MPLLTTAGATALLLLLPTARAFRCYAYTTVSTSNSADPPYLPPKECDGCKAHRLANVGNLSGLTWHGYMHDSPQDCRDALNNAEPAADYDAEGDEAGGGGAWELSEDDCYAIVNCSKLTTFEGEEEAESYNGFGYMFNCLYGGRVCCLRLGHPSTCPRHLRTLETTHPRRTTKRPNLFH